MPIQKNDFVELDYTGKLKDSGEVFDTTLESVAKESGLHSEKSVYSSVIVCVGQAQMLKGLDFALEGKSLGNFTVSLSADEAFGKKDAKLMRLIPMNRFLEQGIRPVIGLQLNMDGVMGTVRAISGGRIIVDFNHPLSGKDVVYDVVVKRVVQDSAEKVKAWVKREWRVDSEVAVNDKTAVVLVDTDIPTEIAVDAAKKLVELVGLQTVEFRNKNSKIIEPVEVQQKEALTSKQESKTELSSESKLISQEKASVSDSTSGQTIADPKLADKKQSV